MHDLTYLRDLVIILGLAVAVVAVLHRLKIPSIAGFIIAGIIVGPGALALISDISKVELLAEIGVALLLFGIGLELSLERLKRLWWAVIIGGLVQVGLSILIAFGVASLMGYSARTSLFIGFLLAVSSTAIVLRGLETRGELDAPHGRLTLGILVFQDLCVVPMMLAIPLLSGGDASMGDLLKTLGNAVLVIVGVLVAARFIVPHVLHFIARTRQRHLFVLSVLLICIGTAWVISRAGVSLALGAFLAGLVVAGSEYRQQALADMISFKDVFTSIFFISVGMLLTPANVINNIVAVLLLLAAILVGKFIVVFITATIMRLPLRACVLTGAALAQVGEFSFILMNGARGTGLLTAALESNLLAAAILSMLITPFLLAFGPHLAAGVGKIHFLTRLLNVKTADDIAVAKGKLNDHVIIGGFGFAGKELAGALKDCGVPYLIAELNTETVRRAVKDGEPAYFCDITDHEVLEMLGVKHARGLVIVINDPGAVERAVRAARSASSSIRIIARTNYLLDVKPLLDAGADEVIPAEREAAAGIVKTILNRCEIDSAVAGDKIASIRKKVQEDFHD
ncbi:MAG: cation:proton antiporter [candidate division Zixibacteria bacterium]|nr:cation:proton antiporter [candidate division Zixibacteria bacterium]